MILAGSGPEHHRPEPEAAGFVLAGGKSSRMGRDKSLLQFAGRPLIEHALSILRQAHLPASIAGIPQSGSAAPGRTGVAGSSMAEFAPTVEDAEPGLGPLAGICAAIASTPARYVVFLPVDLPLLPASLLTFLLSHAAITGRAVTVPALSGFTQTFPAVLNRDVLPVLKQALDAGRGGCFSAFQAAAASAGQSISSVAVELLAQSGHVAHPDGLPPVLWFLNLNTPRDLERAEALAGSRIA